LGVERKKSTKPRKKKKEEKKHKGHVSSREPRVLLKGRGGGKKLIQGKGRTRGGKKKKGVGKKKNCSRIQARKKQGASQDPGRTR